MLEILVHTRIGKVPKTHLYVIGELSDKIYSESVSPKQLPAGWDLPEAVVARGFGDCWIREQRSAALLVPSVVTGGEGNVVINPLYIDVRKIRVSNPIPANWDSRLFVQTDERK